MKTTNIPSGAQRVSIVGLVWRQLRAAGVNGATTHRVPAQSTLRVSMGSGAAGTTTVTLDAISAITLRPGETEYINVGLGIDSNSTRTVVAVVTGNDVTISVSAETDKAERYTP